MSKSPSISFVIPAFNCAGTLAESVESILSTNFSTGDEVIIVNDFSTDATAKVIGTLQKKYPHIIAVHNEQNKGCPATRNVGIARAKNSLIFNLDSDNILAPESIAPLKEYLLQTNADVAAFSEYHYFKSSTKKVSHKWVFNKPVMTLADFLSGPVNPGPGGNFLYTKDSWQKIGGYWEYGKGLHEAWGFTLKQLANGAKFVVLPGSFYFHRYGHDSLFVTESKKKDESSLMATKMLVNFKHLLHPEDAVYISSAEGSVSWFENFFTRPIRLAHEPLGTTGFILRTASSKKTKLAFIKGRVRTVQKYLSFIKDFRSFKKMSAGRFAPSWSIRKPMLFDNTKTTDYDAHYVLHPAWAARVVKEINPKVHVDISSTLTFSTMLSAFIPVDFYDYRPAHLNLSGLASKRADLMDLPFESNSVSSISCMHTIEHIGLGRYGDPLDPQGDLKAIDELKRVTAPGGNLIFVTPVGKSKLIYNAHRIYSYSQILSYFEGFELKEFSLIPDNARTTGIIKNAPEELADNQNYGCGCFWFVKK
jgi:glycosyltransferase involved in cell wall biosynthesis